MLISGQIGLVMVAHSQNGMLLGQKRSELLIRARPWMNLRNKQKSIMWRKNLSSSVHIIKVAYE